MAQTKTNVLPIGQTFSSPPTMRLFGLFDYGPKFQTEALPSAPRTSRHLCGRLKCRKTEHGHGRRTAASEPLAQLSRVSWIGVDCRRPERPLALCRGAWAWHGW